MTNPENVVISSDDYLLSISDDPYTFYITRRDEKEFDENYKLIASDMFQTYICFGLMSANSSNAVIAKYSFSLADDRKTIIINLISGEELKDPEPSNDSSSEVSESDSAPTPEQIADLIERRRKKKTFWYKLKKLFGL